jgi:hypothetical protein
MVSLRDSIQSNSFPVTSAVSFARDGNRVVSENYYVVILAYNYMLITIAREYQGRAID